MIGLIILIFGLIACARGENPAEERAKLAEQADGEIIIGAAAPWSHIQDRLWEGIQIAVQEVNQKGGVLGRKIRVIRGDDEASVTKGQAIAQQFAETEDMVAVIGHYNSYVTVPTSIIYEYYGLLMLTPMSTSPKLTQQGFKLIFRNIPDDNAFGRELADFCANRGYKSMVIYHANDDYGIGLANAFEMQSEKNGIAILDRLDHDSLTSPRMFRKDLMYWKDNFYFDAIFLAGVNPQVALFIREARKLGITVPVVGGDGLDSPELIQIAGENADNTFVGSVFNPERPDKKTVEFVEAFSNKFKATPDTAAAQGYDAVHVIAHAINKARSTVPHKIADALHATKNWEGVTGIHTFNEKGDVVDKKISIKVVRDGRFQYALSQ
jgi:branched-chain amino acid transport system substrate-binding protein